VRQPGNHEVRFVSSVSVEQYPQALPVFLRWFPRVTSLRSKCSIASTLASVRHRQAEIAKVILAEYRKLPPELDDHDKELIASTVQRVADDSVFDDLVERIQTRTDPHRGQCALALGKMRMCRKRAIGLLLQLLDDRELAVYAIHALGDLRSVEALPHICAFAEGPDAELRNAARQVLPSLEKAVLRAGTSD
jgi:hypothetical protein